MARCIVRHPHAIDATSQRVPLTQRTLLSNLVQHGFRHFNLCKSEVQQRSELSQPSGVPIHYDSSERVAANFAELAYVRH